MRHSDPASIDFSFADPLPLPGPDHAGRVHFAGADIAFATFGAGPAVLLLHGALGNADDWGNQIPVLVDAGYRVIAIDSRGRGRSTRGGPKLSYELMAREALAVMDGLEIFRFAVVGWSDGAIIGLVLAMHESDRVAGVVAYAGNMNLDGVHAEPRFTPAMQQSFRRAMADYARLSETPDQVDAMRAEMDELMHSQPNFSAEDLAGISPPVAIVHGAYDEFIKREHAEYLAATIPKAELRLIEAASHFAPWQKPDAFDRIMLSFLNKVTDGRS